MAPASATGSLEKMPEMAKEGHSAGVSEPDYWDFDDIMRALDAELEERIRRTYDEEKRKELQNALRGK